MWTLRRDPTQKPTDTRKQQGNKHLFDEKYRV